MENQHQKIKGYRDLSQEEIDLMNEAKALGEQLGELINKLKIKADANGTIDKRWVCIGETHLQQGVMAAVRSIARPTTF